MTWFQVNVSPVSGHNVGHPRNVDHKKSFKIFSHFCIPFFAHLLGEATNILKPVERLYLSNGSGMQLT